MARPMYENPLLLSHRSDEIEVGLKVKVEDIYIDGKLPALITEALSKMYHALPYKIVDNQLYIAMKEPNDLQTVKALRFASGYYIVPVQALGERLDDFILYHYRLLELEEITAFLYIEQKGNKLKDFLKLKNKVITLLTQQQSEAILRVIDILIELAIYIQASDIHIEPSEYEIQVRFRVSGVLRNIITIPLKFYPVFINRIKLMARLNIAKKKKPQDGSIHINNEQMRASLRISTIASTNGEKLVIRVLSKTQFIRTESELGFSSTNLLLKRSIMKNRQGIIIVSGPTGSGKTTTLYSLLQEINNSKYNIVTIEDPVEYQMNGITQIQVVPQHDMTFINILRAVLRQDPDVILLGEIRDSETAETAFAASMTGHFILTTIHTNDTVSTISRLINLGVDPYFIASSLKGVIAQRLLSVLCPHCKEPYESNDEEINFLRISEKVTLYKVCGCDFCQYTGYHGRLSIHEVLEIDYEIRQLIERAETNAIIQKARDAGLKTLLDACREYVLGGLVSIDEMYIIGD